MAVTAPIAIVLTAAVLFAPATAGESRQAELMAEIRTALEAGDSERAEALARQLRTISEAQRDREKVAIEAAEDNERHRQKTRDFERLRARERARRESPEYRIALAARRGDLGTVKALARAGAALNSYSLDPAPPLFEAVLSRHREVVAWLLDNGAAMHVTGKPRPLARLDALNMAVYAEEDNSPIIRDLVARGAPLDARNDTIPSLALSGDAEGRERFTGGAPLWTAIEMRRYRHARTLLELGADPDIFDRGTTPLMLAAGRLVPDAVALLLEFGADVNLASGPANPLTMVENTEETPQNRARRERTIRLLRDAGARRPAAEPDRALVLPADFPIPSPHGGRVITDGWSGGRGHITIRYPRGRRGDILDFYDRHSAGPGWRRREMGRSETPAVNFMNLSRRQDIAVGSPRGDHLAVTLTVF